MPCGEDYFISEKEKNEKVSGKFLYAVTDFSIFKKDEAYWLEYIGNDTYVGRSDNILNQKVEIAPRHLVWYFSEKPRSAFEKELADWFYGMRTWGLDVGDVGCEAFCDSQAHKAAKRLLMYVPTLNDDDITEDYQEKKLPEGLEKAAGEYAVDNAQYYYEDDDNAICSTADILKPAFIAGAEWGAEHTKQKPELVQHPAIGYMYNADAGRGEQMKQAILALLKSDLIQVAGRGFTKTELIDWVETRPAKIKEDER